MRRRIWQFLLPIYHDVSSDRAWWLPYREPCVSCQSPASAGLGSPGDSRSHSGHVGNTRRRRVITCCLLWPAARRFWLGLHLVSGELCWETYVGSFYIATTILVYIWFRAMKHIFSIFYQFRVVLSFQIIGSPPAQSINRLVLQMRVPLEPLVVNQQGSYDNCARCYMLLFF